jgi:lysophospholipase L1-like esterase
MSVTHRLRPLLLAAALCGSVAALADVPDPDPTRFAAEIEAFVAWDSKNAVPVDGILFVGSSSMRLWATAEAFPGQPVINRGFGGSELSDVLHFYDRIILPYAPAAIFVYAGDNDIEHGKPADQVYGDWLELADRILEDLPGCRLYFLSIKPSKARWAIWPEMQEANRRVREHAAGHERLGYVDLAAPLLGADGLPKDVYLGDGLHLNADGYALWREALAPYLQ